MACSPQRRHQRQEAHLAAPATNLAAELSSFVGRGRELAELDRLLSGPDRLVVVVGPGGVGKTRLAREAGLRAAGRFPGGAWFCDLVSARFAADIAATVRRVLDLAPASGAAQDEALAAVGRGLAARDELLLVLDNLEQVVDAAPATVARWLSAAPSLRILATSRERLRVPGEVTLPLEPLSLPEADVAGAESVQLFVDRARAVRAGFALDAANAQAVVEVVRHLDGLPLAIELAAARLSVLSVQQLAARLSAGTDVLPAAADGRDHRRTLHAAIDWSWQLLEPAERSALAQCGVFHGGFDLAAAEAVVRLPDAPPVLDVLQALVEKSLLRAASPRELPDELRYSLLESIREFALGRLAAEGDPAAVHERHARHYARHGTELAARTQRREGLTWLRRLALEQDNLLAVIRDALARAPQGPAVQTALEAALAVEPCVLAFGSWAWFVELLGSLLVHAGPAAPAGLAARAELARARGLRLCGRRSEARDVAGRALELARGARDEAAEAEGLLLLASAGGPGDSRAFEEQALAIYQRIGDRRGEGRALVSLAYASHQSGDFAQMDALVRRALALFDRDEDRRGELAALDLAGAAALERGQLAQARELLERAVGLTRERAEPRLLRIAESLLAALDQEEGRLPAARDRYERALAEAERDGDRLYEALFNSYLGRLLVEQDELPSAVARLRRALGYGSDTMRPHTEALVRGWLAVALSRLGRPEQAEQALAEAERFEVDGSAGGSGGAAGGPIFRAFRAHLELARARAADARGEPDEARRAWQAVQRCLRAGEDGASSEEVRTVLRVLARFAAEAGAPGSSLVVEREARWFRPPGSERVSFKRQKALRGILRRLSELHEADPGASLTLAAMQEAGWPGEKMTAAAGANRVHVAVTTLRKLGLGESLQSGDAGWRLDPGLEVVLADDEDGATGR